MLFSSRSIVEVLGVFGEIVGRLLARVVREQLDSLKQLESEAHAELEHCKSLMAPPLTPLSAGKVAKFSGELRTRITEGEVSLRKAYIRAFVDQMTVASTQIAITGRKDALASAAAKEAIVPTGGVLTYVPEWCARPESKRRPTASG